MENTDFIKLAKEAKKASVKAQGLCSDTKNKALKAVAKAIEDNKQKIFDANKKDLEFAAELVKNGELSNATFNRLKLDENKMRDMIQGILDISNLEDPVNKKLLVRELDEGLTLYKVSCPIGVLGIIFEARPDVISQISSLAIKSSNAVILKGGKESKNTNKTILEIINSALDTIEEFPKNFLNQVFSRDDVAKMLDADKYIDLIIPRGGNNLVKFIKSNTKIPVLGHADGICHIYIDKDAEMFNQPPYSLSFFPSGDGIKKETELSLSNENIIMTAYKALTDDKKLIRLFNSLGTDTKAKLINNDNSFEIVFTAYEVKTMILTDNSLRETDMLSE